MRGSDCTSAAIIRKLAHATPGTNIPNVTERNGSETQKECEARGKSGWTDTRPSLPLHKSLLPSLVKLHARTEPLQVMEPMLLRVAGLSRVTTPWFPGAWENKW